MFKVCFSAIVVALAVVVAMPATGQDKKKDEKKAEQKRPSPTETVSAKLGGKEVKIVYSRPFTKDPKTGEKRKIWGTLVPWGKLWRTGANEATAFETEGALVVGGAAVPAGKYTIYSLIEEKGPSKLAISKTTGQLGEPIDDKNDLARVDLKQEKAEKNTDQFTIAIDVDKTGNAGTLKMMWDELQFSVPIAAAKK